MELMWIFTGSLPPLRSANEESGVARSHAHRGDMGYHVNGVTVRESLECNLSKLLQLQQGDELKQQPSANITAALEQQLQIDTADKGEDPKFTLLAVLQPSAQPACQDKLAEVFRKLVLHLPGTT
ncbi:hypothetical protein MHYP_G00165900 [Metynnis hypsauchen]